MKKVLTIFMFMIVAFAANSQCTPPTVDGVCNPAGAAEFYIDVQVLTGSGSSYTISTDFSPTTWTTTVGTTTSIGVFPNGTFIDITITDDDDNTCFILLEDVTNGCTSLPVEVIDESVFYDKRYNKIVFNVTTASEENNDGFSCECAVEDDLTAYQVLGWIKGNGTSNLINKYSLLVDNPTRNLNYYCRINQVDLDGTVTKGNLHYVNTNTKLNEVFAFPNPSKDGRINLLVENPDEVTNVIVYDILGNVVSHSTNWQSSIYLEVKGVYYLQIVSTSQQEMIPIIRN